MFEDIVETVREPLIVLDSELRVLSANRSFYESFKVIPEETIGNLIYDLGNRQWDIPRLRALLENILPENNKFDDYEVEHIFSGVGRKIMLLNARRVIHKEKGSQMTILLAIEDITERKRIEGLLEASEEKYRDLVENVNSIILKMDPEGKITFFNTFAQRFFGFTEKEMLGRSAAGTIVPETVPPAFNPVFMIRDIEIHPEKHVNNENENMRRNGERVWVAWTNKVLCDENGKTIEILCIGNDITERRRMEQELKDYEERYRRLFETSKDGLLLIDKQNGEIVNVNPAITEMLGYLSKECIGKQVQDVGLLNDMPDFKETIRELIHIGFINYEDVSAETKLGQRIDVDIHLVDRARFIQCNVRNITVRKKLSAQLLQSQKMEAIGHLVGGIAHDFNNILTAIIGYGSLLFKKILADDPLHHYVEQILASSDRAANLTHSLLAYSRKHVMELKRTDANKIVSGIQKTLDRLIGEDVECRLDLTDEQLVVNVDIRQIEQVLLNLATNARDAMPQGGVLAMRTEHVQIDSSFILANSYGEAGNYAVLVVEDTGCGMDEKTKEHMFEPFFTTKEAEKGTGLGLAMVYSIVKQHRGFIHVSSTPGTGTTFKIYLPFMRMKEETLEVAELTAIPSGNETILLAEDDHALRRVSKIFLEEYGYKVLEAVNGADAIAVFAENSAGINLIVTDMIMPKMPGNTVYEKARAIRPDIKCLFMSGYSSNIIKKIGIFKEQFNYISKPFNPYNLLRKIREVLDS